MKKIKIYFVLLVSVFITGIGSVYAQTEITVDPGFNTLYDAVVANPGATLILLRGEQYVNDQTILINEPTIIKGETTPAEMAPAVISIFADPGTASGLDIFSPGADLTLQNLGLMGFTDDEQQIRHVLTLQTANTKITLDGCILQGMNWMLATNDVPGVTILLKNCKIFNSVNTGFDNWGGYGTLWGGNNITYQSYNNTAFMVGRIYNAGWIGPQGSETLDHNTYVNIFGELFYPAWVESDSVTNNILYNPNIRGYVGPRTVPEEYAGDFIGDYPNDTLNGDVAIFTNHTDSTTGDRNIVIQNNLRFTNSKVLDRQASLNITMEPFVGEVMKSYIAKYNWTYKDNWVDGDPLSPSVDPQFAMAIPDEAYDFMFMEMEARRRVSLQVGGYPWSCGWWPNGVTKGTFIWPLPFDFKPMNQDLWYAGDDGYPLGDLNWFGPGVVAAWEAALPNPLSAIAKNQLDRFNLTTYPNPVKSNTRISYTLTKNSQVKLTVYNAIGVEMATLVNTAQAAGKHEVNFDASRLSSGMYFCKIQVAGKSVMQKMVVVK